ncbi:hypothetical protein HDU86_003192 [Geranomyces michiganensis]|nr:hypothetical protein HDU86_003192 [Geranomyces michiganensis]
MTTYYSEHQHPRPGPPARWSHRHFPTYHPTSSKLLSKKWEERAREIHLAKLRNVSCSVDNTPPKRWAHLEVRLKRLQVEQERLYEIERNNHILLDRIAFQMQTPSAVHAPQPANSPTSHYPGSVSLHGPKRAQELKNIARENEHIMQRIEDKAPNYRRTEWGIERCRNLNYLRNITTFSESYERVLDKHCEIEKESPKRGRSAAPHVVASKAKVSPRATTAGGGGGGSTGSSKGGAADQPTESWIPKLSKTGRPLTAVNPMRGPLSEFGTDDFDGSVVVGREDSEQASYRGKTDLESQPSGCESGQSGEKLPRLTSSRPTSAVVGSRPTSAALSS